MITFNCHLWSPSPWLTPLWADIQGTWWLFLLSLPQLFLIRLLQCSLWTSDTCPFIVSHYSLSVQVSVSLYLPPSPVSPTLAPYSLLPCHVFSDFLQSSPNLVKKLSLWNLFSHQPTLSTAPIFCLFMSFWLCNSTHLCLQMLWSHFHPPHDPFLSFELLCLPASPSSASLLSSLIQSILLLIKSMLQNIN